MTRPMTCFLVSILILGASDLRAQTPPSPPSASATKLEGFKSPSGSISTLGYDDLGMVSGVAVDVREMRDARNIPVRGLLVQVSEGQGRSEHSFVDADEVAELLRGIDALLGITANPTQFRNFETRYTTRGELQLTAYNSGSSLIQYAVQAGRGMKAQRTGLSPSDMQRLRAVFASGLQKLQATTAK